MYHPDKNNSPNAEQKFRDLVEGENRHIHTVHQIQQPNPKLLNQISKKNS